MEVRFNGGGSMRSGSANVAAYRSPLEARNPNVKRTSTPAMPPDEGQTTTREGASGTSPLVMRGIECKHRICTNCATLYMRLHATAVLSSDPA
jgi:hypothetical protein